MPTVKISIPTSLRTSAFPSGQVTVQARSIREALHALCEADDAFGQRVLLPDGKLRVSLIVCVGKQMRVRGEWDSPLQEQDELMLVSPVSGG